MNKQAGPDGLLQMFESERAFIQQQLKRDSAFLSRNNIMDYSLLLCIEKRLENLSDRGVSGTESMPFDVKNLNQTNSLKS